MFRYQPGIPLANRMHVLAHVQDSAQDSLQEHFFVDGVSWKRDDKPLLARGPLLRLPFIHLPTDTSAILSACFVQIIRLGDYVDIWKMFWPQQMISMTVG